MFSRGLVHTCANDRKANAPNSCGWTIRGILMFCTMAYTPIGTPDAPQTHLKTRQTVQVKNKIDESGSRRTLGTERAPRLTFPYSSSIPAGPFVWSSKLYLTQQCWIISFWLVARRCALTYGAEGIFCGSIGGHLQGRPLDCGFAWSYVQPATLEREGTRGSMHIYPCGESVHKSCDRRRHICIGNKLASASN